MPTSWEGVECLNWSPLVYANEATKVTVTWRGVLHPRMGRWEAWLWRGPADKTCDWRAVHAGYHAIPSKDKSLWSVPGMPHKVDERVYREIGAWLDAD